MARWTGEKIEEGWDYDDVYEEFEDYFNDFSLNDLENPKDEIDNLQDQFDATWSMLEDGYSSGKLPDNDSLKDAEKVFMRTANKALGAVKGKKKKDKKGQVSPEQSPNKDEGISGMAMFGVGAGVTVLLTGTCITAAVCYLRNTRRNRKRSNRNIDSDTNEMSDYQVQREIDTPDEIAAEVK